MAGLAIAKIFHSLPEAGVVKAMLEANGIPAFLFDEHTGSNMIQFGGVCRIRLMISEADVETVARLIAYSPSMAGGEADEAE